ncbi:hypothetical protein JG688_00014227, partial [Phytophthora aleatoria]
AAARVSPKATEHRLSRESFKQVLGEVNADVSERVFAVLTPQIATVARVTAGPRLSSPVRGIRSMFQRFQETRNLTEVVAPVIPEPIDLENAAEQEEILRRESLQLASSAASRDLEQTKKDVCRLRELDQQAARSSFRSSLQIELENADDGEVLSLLNAVALIPSSDDESDEGSVLQLVVSPVPPTKTSSESLQSSESSAKPPAASEPLVVIDSPGEVVPEVSASLSVDVDEVRKSPASTHDQGPGHNFVDDVESDAESTSTLVFASGDESKANTPTDSAVLPSVARGSSVETYSVAVDDSPPGESAAQDEAAISTNKMPPLVRFSKQVVKWAVPFLTPTFSRQGAFKVLGPDPELSAANSPRAIKLFLAAGYRILEEDDTLSPTLKAQIKQGPDEAKAAWEGYAAALGARYGEIISETLFERSMPGYWFEYLTWIPASLNLLSYKCLPLLPLLLVLRQLPLMTLLRTPVNRRSLTMLIFFDSSPE